LPEFDQWFDDEIEKLVKKDSVKYSLKKGTKEYAAAVTEVAKNYSTVMANHKKERKKKTEMKKVLKANSEKSVDELKQMKLITIESDDSDDSDDLEKVVRPLKKVRSL